MPYTATIQRVSDGKLFEVPLEFEWNKGDDATDQFWWEDGNFACDCNRAGLINDEDESCGDSRYRVRITLPDGTVPYDEIGGQGGEGTACEPCKGTGSLHGYGCAFCGGFASRTGSGRQGG